MKGAKFGNKKVEVDGVVFDSRAEAARYQQLKLLERCGVISELELQPVYQLQPAFRDCKGKHHRAITYRADFGYVEDGRDVAEDVKGAVTEVFKIKMKLLLHNYPDLDFRIVKVK